MSSSVGKSFLFEVDKVLLDFLPLLTVVVVAAVDDPSPTPFALPFVVDLSGTAAGMGAVELTMSSIGSGS